MVLTNQSIFNLTHNLVSSKFFLYKLFIAVLPSAGFWTSGSCLSGKCFTNKLLPHPLKYCSSFFFFLFCRGGVRVSFCLFDMFLFEVPCCIKIKSWNAMVVWERNCDLGQLHVLLILLTGCKCSPSGHNSPCLSWLDNLHLPLSLWFVGPFVFWRVVGTGK